MGRLVLALGLMSCMHGASTSPAWPKAAAQDKDGGESLAPHESKSIVVASDKAGADVKPEAAKPDIKPAVGAIEGIAPAVIPALTQPTDETVTTDDIIIE